MAISVDPAEFNEWAREARRLVDGEDDLLHAFRAIKTLEAIKFTLTVEPDPVEKLQKIEGIVDEWH